MNTLNKLNGNQLKFVQEFARLGFKNQREALQSVFPDKKQMAIDKQALRWMQDPNIQSAIEDLKREKKIKEAELELNNTKKKIEAAKQEQIEEANKVLDIAESKEIIAERKLTSSEVSLKISQELANNPGAFRQFGMATLIEFLLNEVQIDNEGKIKAFVLNNHRFSEHFSDFVKLLISADPSKILAKAVADASKAETEGSSFTVNNTQINFTK